MSESRGFFDIDWRGYGVDVPAHDTEFEVQAFMWYQLRSLGYCVRGETVQVYGRLDLLVLDNSNRRPLCVIEVKAINGISTSAVYKIQRQLQRYRDGSCCKVLLVSGMREAEIFVESVKIHGIEKIKRINRNLGIATVEIFNDRDTIVNGMSLDEFRSHVENDR